MSNINNPFPHLAPPAFPKHCSFTGRWFNGSMIFKFDWRSADRSKYKDLKKLNKAKCS